MTKKLAFLWGILCLLCCACGKGDDLPEENLIRQLKNPGNVSGITLQEMTDFDWDSMYYFTPYTDKEAAEKAIGFSSDDILDNLSSDDSVYALFVKDREVVCQMQGLPENLGFQFDFGEIDSYIKLDQKTTINFTVKKDDKIVTYKKK